MTGFASDAGTTPERQNANLKTAIPTYDKTLILFYCI